MSDIVDRLRLAAKEPDGCCYGETMETAADEIERLRALLKPFTVVKEIDDPRFDDEHPVMIALNGSWCYDEAACNMTLGDFRRVRAALEPSIMNVDSDTAD